MDGEGDTMNYVAGTVLSNPRRTVARPTNSEADDEVILIRKEFDLRILVSIAVLGLLTLPAQAQALPEWAYPVNPTLTPLDDTVKKHLADSTKAYTQAQIDD